MPGRILRLFSAEIAKAWRTKFPYLGIAASALMAVVARQSIEQFQSSEVVTGPSYFPAAVNMATTLIIPIFATIFGSMLVASETSRGTLRTVLTRPVSRADFLTSKLLSGIFYLFLLVAANLATAALIASNYPIKSAFDEGIRIPDLAGQIAIFATAILLTLLPLVATVCFGFMVSVLSVSVATAIGVAVGLLMAIQTAKELIRFRNFALSDWLFLSYYDTAMGIASSKVSGIYDEWGQNSVYLLAGTSLASIALFLGVSYWLFLRRDLNY